jgi:hypothetical protein
VILQEVSRVRFFFAPKAIAFGGAIFLLIYVGFEERRIEDFAGCWHCGWQTRQVFLLFVAAALVLVLRWWTSLLSLVASLKVIISLSLVTFLSDLAEIERPWPALKSSCGLFYETHPEFLLETAIALFLICVSVRYLCRLVGDRFVKI